MAEYQEYFQMLDADPGNRSALAAIEKLDREVLRGNEITTVLAATRTSLRERGALEVVARLFDLEIGAAADDSRRADLLLQKGHLYIDDLLDESVGVQCLERVLEIRPNDEDAQDTLEHLGLVRENWQQIVEKYLSEASASTDRKLTTSLYLSAAETFARYKPDAPEVEEYLSRALDVDAGNKKAALHLERLYRQREAWKQLADLLEARVDAASDKKSRIQALLSLAETAQNQLADHDRAAAAMKKVVGLDPGHPRALSMLSDVYEQSENWSALVMLYTNALKVRRRGSKKETEIGVLLQIAMLHWRRLENIDAAEEHFRRVRKLSPAHPAALDFYRDYYNHPNHTDVAKLVQVLRQAQKSLPKTESDKIRALSVEIATLAENQLSNPEKAIDAWKSILRSEPSAHDAREALMRLYARTEKWNALLDLMKEDIDQLPEDDNAGRVAGLLGIVEIYRDRLKLDVMVINTYNAVLAIDPDHAGALDALAEKYESLGRWNDLVSVLARKAESQGRDPAERARILRQISTLWIERFGNYAQAVKPLERLVELLPPGSPESHEAVGQLKDIYTRRRQWRALIALSQKEAAGLPFEARRPLLADTAKLASDRLGDVKLAISCWNRVLELPEAEPPPVESAGDDDATEAVAPAFGPTTHDVLVALAGLYDKDKRYIALADVLDRLATATENDRERIAVLERLGSLHSDRLKSPAHAAAAYRRILDFDPANQRATRTLRELYAAQGDYDSLEAMYAAQGMYEELVEAMFAIADRRLPADQRLPLLERAAAIAAEHVGSRDRVARAYERVLSVAPAHLPAARALVPIYKDGARWARLLSTYELLLAEATKQDDRDQQLSLMQEIRALSEHQLGSKAQAFQWTARAYRLNPNDPDLLSDLERLGADADAWDDVTTILGARADSEGTGDDERLRLYRQLARIAQTRLHQPDLAHDYLEKVLALSPDDPDAMRALEDIASHRSDWPELLKIYRRRADLETEPATKVELLFKIASIEEDRQQDQAAAAETYRRVLDVDGESRRALKALSRIHEAAGDHTALASVLETELSLTRDADARLTGLLRLGSLYENQLDRRDDALTAYKQALDMGQSGHVHQALERFLSDEREPVRVEVAELLLPVYEHADDAERITRAVEILRSAASDSEKVDYERRLVGLYRGRLGEPRKAYDAALRVFAADPGDRDVRAELTSLAAGEDLFGDLARNFGQTLSAGLNSPDSDPTVMQQLATEVAEMHEGRLGDLEAAEISWLTVLDLDPVSERAFDALERIYRLTDKWTDLRELFERKVGVTSDPDQRRDTLLSISQLCETVLDDADGAIASYRRVIDLDSSYLPAYKALERLYAAAGSYEDLEQLLAAEVDYLGSDVERNKATSWRAALRAKKLDNPGGAIDLLEEVLAVDRNDLSARGLLEELLTDGENKVRVARTLEPLYQEDGMWRDLCDVLSVQVAAADSRVEKLELYARIADVEETRMGNARGAFEMWNKALSVDGADERPREALLRLGGELGNFSQVASAFEGALDTVDSSDIALRAELLRQCALIYDRLSDSDKAMSSYRRLLDVDPGNPESAAFAADALARLYEDSGRWQELVDILRKQAEWASSPDERARLFARVAQVSEIDLEDQPAAIAAWRELLEEMGDDQRALDALERLHSMRGENDELISILRRRVDLSSDALDKKSLLFRMAALHEHQRDSRDDAIISHLEVLDEVAEDPDSLSELSRLYRMSERYEDLLSVSERRFDAADGEARTELAFEIAELLHRHLSRPHDAMARYASVLSVHPTHNAAIMAVEELSAEPDLRTQAAATLEPIYEHAGDHAKLAQLLERVARGSDDPRTKVANLVRVARLREQALGDRNAAIDTYIAAVRAAVSEPELPELLRELERLSSEEGRVGELVSVYQEIAPDVFDADLQRRLYLDIADLARGVQQDPDLAREFYQKVLDAQPDDPRALAALEGIYREAGEHAKLYEVLTRRAELAAADDAGDRLDDRVAFLTEAASLLSEHLERSSDAIVTWEQVLECIPDHAEAATALAELYEQGERWHDLTELLERRLGFAYSIDEAVALRFRLGKICDDKLRDPDRAVENYSAVLGGDPSHAEATAALERYLDDASLRTLAAEVLEPIYVSKQDWPQLVRIYEIKLEASEDPAHRLQITRYIARLFEDQLEDMDGAFVWYGKVFREAPGDRAIRDQLVRLANILSRWVDLADIYSDYLDDEPGDSPDTRSVALQLAEICGQRLGAIERARTAYRRVLESNPDDTTTFGQLEHLLTQNKRWDLLVESYEEAVHATLDDGHRQDIYVRLARVLEDHVDDAPRAIDAYQAVLNINPENRTAVSELDRLFKKQEQWYELAELLGKRIESETDPVAMREHRLRLAELFEGHMHDIGAALDQYEIMLAEGEIEAALPPLERLVVDNSHRERIAYLLEPVYRQNDWWQKLVVILDAKLEFINDPTERVESLREIAQIHEARGGDPRLAMKALSRAWHADVSNRDVYAQLLELGGKLGAYRELLPVLEKGIADQYDDDLSATVLAEIARVQERELSEPETAVATWRRYLEVRPDELEALEALDRLLSALDRPDELVSVLTRRADLLGDGSMQKHLLKRVAVLHEERLDAPLEAIASHRAILAIDDTDRSSLDALERLYRAEADFAELSSVLAQKIELSESADERRALRFAAAEVAAINLDDTYDAISQYQAVLTDDPTDASALEALDTLHKQNGSWPELIEVLDRRAELASDPSTKAQFLFRAATITRAELYDQPAAIDRLAGVLAVDPSHVGAVESLSELCADDDTLEPASDVLERYYREQGRTDDLARLQERRLEIEGRDPVVRQQMFAVLAEIHEVSRGDVEAAFGVWSRALAEAPDDEMVVGQLERLAGDRGAWDELAAIYEQRLRDAGDSRIETDFAIKLAKLYEEALGDLPKAAEKYRVALHAADDQTEIMAALARIYERSNQPTELAEILAMQADASLSESEQAQFLLSLGVVREQQLGDVAAALEAYRDVLERDPTHEGARHALERILSMEAHRADAIAILEPLYEAEGDWMRMADLLTTKLSVTEDALDRAGIYERICELAENRLGDATRALDAAGGWLAEDPRSEEALAQVERLAETSGRFSEVGARLSGIISSTDDEMVQRPLLEKLGAVQLSKLGDLEGAEATFLAVLQIDSEATSALESLETLYRHQGNQAALADVLWRRGTIAFDGHDKAVCFTEVGRLREAMGDTVGAETAWRAVLDADEGNGEALGQLVAILERSGRWEDLVDMLGTSARFAPNVDHERAMRTKIARVYTDTIGDLDRAVEAWQSVIDTDPSDLAPLGELEAVHARRDDWQAVYETVLRRLDVVATGPAQIPVFEQLAAVSAERLEATEDAVGYLHQVLDIDPNRMETYTRLSDLLGSLERYHDQVELYEKLAEVRAGSGDDEGAIRALARAADIWEGPLENPDAAGEVLEKIFARDPNFVPALTRLARIYENAGDWDKCEEVLSKALSLGPSGSDAADLYFRLGQVAREKSGDESAAAAHFVKALEFDGNHAGAIEAVEAAAREREDWPLVADMVGRRYSGAADEGARLELAVELADLYRGKLGQPDAVIPVLEQAVATAPTDPRVLLPLADLYLAAGRTAEARPLFESLAEAAKKGRKMKDVARYKQRLGEMLEVEGDKPGALSAYEEAFRIDPTNTTTMAGLGRLYLEDENWEKARRVFRSMVLQNIDEGLGITKGDVYYNLGYIHVQLGESQKAKGMFQRGIEIEPNHEQLRAALATL